MTRHPGIQMLKQTVEIRICLVQIVNTEKYVRQFAVCRDHRLTRCFLFFFLTRDAVRVLYKIIADLATPQ